MGIRGHPTFQKQKEKLVVKAKEEVQDAVWQQLLDGSYH